VTNVLRCELAASRNPDRLCSRCHLFLLFSALPSSATEGRMRDGRVSRRVRKRLFEKSFSDLAAGRPGGRALPSGLSSARW
jgi:hypothetical protein